MPKEITHIIIARKVFYRLKASGTNARLGGIAEIIEHHRQAFYLGSIIPDAYFYHLLPWPPVPATLPTVTQVLHLKNHRENNELTKNLLGAAAADKDSPSMKIAFCAGMITHTVSDGFFHEIIDYYCRQWQETGRRALGTHRQLETLFDEVLMEMSGETPHDFPLEESISVGPSAFRCLLDFSVSRLAPPPPSSYGPMITAFRQAHAQQLFLLRQFKKAPAFRTARLASKISRGRTESISALFYPPAISRKFFPVLDRVNVGLLTDGKNFEGDLTALTRRITDQAIHYIETSR